jgi:hypothetical protein
MAFLHDPRIKVLGTRGHMVRLRRGPLLFNFRANHMEFKNLKTARWCHLSSRAAIAGRGQAAADKRSRQDHGRPFPRARRVGGGVTKPRRTTGRATIIRTTRTSRRRNDQDQDRATTCSGFKYLTRICITTPKCLSKHGEWWSISRPSTRAAKVVSGFGEAGQRSAGWP